MYTFADLFCGIGGFHLALHNLGLKCVMACDINDKARSTYELNFKDKSPDIFKNNLFYKDIHHVDEKTIPDFDIICAGFPCQPFSLAGFKRGFEDERGNLFFEITRLIKHKRPKAFFLENVRHLEKHDNGRTLETIINALTKELGYSFYYQILKASDYGLPQNRPRIFMVGFDKTRLVENAPSFLFPPKRALKMTMSDVFEGNCEKTIGFTLRVGGKGSAITDRRNRDGYIVDGKERRVTPKEGKRMQGFPDNFEFPVTNNEAMKQLGNSVAIDAIQYTAQEIVKYLDKFFIK